MMFFSFLLIVGRPLPIERFPCAANINGNFFNITELANGRDFGFDIIRQNNKDNYYFKICGTLSNDDLPPLAPDSTDISVMRCNYSSHLCASAIPLQSFDWKLIHANNPNDGVIYFAAGEPFVDPEDKKYYTIDFEIELHCDKSDTKPNTNYTYMIINRTNEVAVKVIFYTAFGCPVPTSTPAPTPEFSPDCEFKFYLSHLTHYGVYTDFQQFNEGPYGIRVPLTVAGNKKTLFYQPCERMRCPTNYTCTDNNNNNNNNIINDFNKKKNMNNLEGYSSAWLCDPTSRLCQNYGLIEDDGIDARIKSIFAESPVIITHHNKAKERDIELEVSCNRKFEYDHFLFEETATITNGKLKVLSSAHDSCYSFNPVPFPPFSGDTCFVDLNFFEDFNMSKFNNGTVDGYTTTVNNGQFTLHYQPCGGMFCPSGAQCDGDVNATVWLCSDQDGYQDCVAYGLLEHNLTYQEKFTSVDVTYVGDRKRMATVSFQCDESAPLDQITMPDKVKLDGTRLSFSVHSGKLCQKEEKQAAITGGAVFLIIIFVGIIIYLAVAMVVGYVKNGRLSPPNEEFWREFFTCVATGFLFIVKCGRISASGAITSSKYDSM